MNFFFFEKWTTSIQDPPRIPVLPKGMKTSSLGHVPDTDGLVFGIGHNQILSWMEDHTRHVVVMTTTSVNFPCLKKCNI
jgi:hypothetical protein